ncbi:apolipoprotein N-acyltransferase [Armatimonas sp.]|uniref:apolipoprotein N-acyltransferase n=1 Tax=Armatimonas sp. TaxID=1872638 RepID=UPI00286B1BB0|nr:apolipoprotein N-acyltransferase [Armatimonas sp.]
MRIAVLALLTGVLLALAFPPAGLWPLAWVVPGLLYTLLTESKPKFTSLSAYLFGVALYLIGAQWVRALAVPLWLLLPLFPTPIFALYGLANGLLLPRLRTLVRPVAFALLWALFEWLRGLGTYAAPWFSLASAHTHPTALPLLQSVSFLGTPGFAFVVALTSALLMEGLRRRQKTYAFALLLPLSLLLFRAPKPPSQSTTLHLALIQAGHANESATDDYIALSRQAALRHPELIVWPEGAATEATISLVQLSALARELKTPLLVGFYADGTNNRPENLAILFDGTGKESGRYSKQRLAPFGEVYPFQHALQPIYASFGIHHDSYRHGERPGVLTLPTGQRIGIGICFESAFPWVATKNTQAGAQIMLFLTSDQAFGQSAALPQHRDLAIVRAIENRRPVAQVATTGITTLIAADGTVQAALAPGKRGILFVHAILPE